MVYYTTEWYGFDLWVKVIDHDGVAYDGSSHTVNVTLPDATTYQMDFDSSESATAGYYSYWFGLDEAPSPGEEDITFTVTDPDGNSSIVVDTVNILPLDPPDVNSFTPSNYYPVAEHITAFFDNVYVNGVLYEEFNITSIDELDEDRWQETNPDEAFIENQKLKLVKNNNNNQSDAGLLFEDPNTIDSIQAEITIDDVSSDKGSAYIEGVFYNNGTNDVLVHLIVKDNIVLYKVRELIVGDRLALIPLAEDTITTISSGATVVASISWDGTTLTFDVDGNSKTYTPVGTIEPPVT